MLLMALESKGIDGDSASLILLFLIENEFKTPSVFFFSCDDILFDILFKFEWTFHTIL